MSKSKHECEYRDVKVGEHVLFWDMDGVEHDALVLSRDELILFLAFVRAEGAIMYAIDVPHVSTKGTHNGCWTA